MATETRTKTKKIDADTHFNLTVDWQDLRDLLPRNALESAERMVWTEAERYVNPQGIRAGFGLAPTRPGSNGGAAPGAPNPERDAEARLAEMDKLGFDMQVLITQTAMPAPLRPGSAKPLWIRTALAQVYNNAAAKLQSQYPDRYIGMITVPWDDIDASVKELERAKGMGLRAVLIAGSYMDKNLDVYELYPFWEAVNSLDLACIVHNTPQPCGGSLVDHTTPYPMVGTERYHELHLGTYLGFGLDYAVSCAALTLGGVLDAFPNLRFLFFEAGAGWMNYAMTGCDRSFYIEPACARTKTLPSELIKKHCLTAVENLEPIEQFVAVHGSENYIIGTDFPHPEFQRLPNATKDILDKPLLSDQDKSNILGGNMARVLRLS